MTEKNIRWLTILLSAALYAASLTQTAYCTNGCKGSFVALLFGPLGILTEAGALAGFISDMFTGNESPFNPATGATFAWLANPAVLASWIMLKRNPNLAFVLSLVATGFILLFLCFSQVIDSEAGHYAKITWLGPGYWFWLLSSIAALAGSLVLLLKRR